MNYFSSNIPAGFEEDGSVVPSFGDGQHEVGFQFDSSVVGDSQEYMDLDLSTVALQDLLHEINPNFLGDLREGAPDLLRALMKQEPTQLDMPAQSRTEELGRAAAFIDDSGGTDESGFKPLYTSSKNEEMIDGRIGSATVSEKTREQSPFQTKTMSNASNTLEEEEEEEASESMPGGNANGGVAAGGAKKKAIRAERNRQSAAASRERKKHHIRELERRVAMLSSENAQLQVDQVHTIQSRINEEKKLTEENQRLKQQLVHLDMKINRLSKQMDEAGISDDKRGSRAKTWTPGDFTTRTKNQM